VHAVGTLTHLERAMDALVKAQDHLNTAADQCSDDMATVLAGIIETVKGLQREVSNVTHHVSSGKPDLDKKD
jgi:hypothetical protein